MNCEPLVERIAKSHRADAIRWRSRASTTTFPHYGLASPVFSFQPRLTSLTARPGPQAEGYCSYAFWITTRSSARLSQREFAPPLSRFWTVSQVVAVSVALERPAELSTSRSCGSSGSSLSLHVERQLSSGADDRSGLRRSWVAFRGAVWVGRWRCQSGQEPPLRALQLAAIRASRYALRLRAAWIMRTPLRWAAALSFVFFCIARSLCF